MSQVSTHVLDAASGRPAEGVQVRLEDAYGAAIASGTTGSDGRIRDFGAEALAVGSYRLLFNTGAYFAASGQDGFYPRVTVDFRITDDADNYHIPVLLSPFAFSTYRGI
jgi:5-hydroxyisourate hydrolase